MNKTIEVSLSIPELTFAAVCGVLRQTENIQKGRQGAHGSDNTRDWQKNIEGALTEYAVAKHCAIFWSGAFDFGKHDVGRFQVRSTSYEGGHLCLHKGDKDDDLFILVIGVNGRYRLMGQIHARDGKIQKYWGRKSATQDEAFWVPQNALEPLDPGNQRAAPPAIVQPSSARLPLAAYEPQF